MFHLGTAQRMDPPSEERKIREDWLGRRLGNSPSATLIDHQYVLEARQTRGEKSSFPTAAPRLVGQHNEVECLPAEEIGAPSDLIDKKATHTV